SIQRQQVQAGQTDARQVGPDRLSPAMLLAPFRMLQVVGQTIEHEVMRSSLRLNGTEGRGDLLLGVRVAGSLGSGDTLTIGSARGFDLARCLPRKSLLVISVAVRSVQRHRPIA